MTTIPMSSSTEVAVVVGPLFSDAERAALAGFLAGYSGQTRDAYTLDLRQYTSWCARQGLRLFTAKRADVECYARDLEARGRARATIARRLCTVAGFYRYAVEEDLLDHSPAGHVRRPRLDYESHAVGLDRNEVGGLLVAAGLGTATEHALISLLAINGLRVSEALGADTDDLGIERGHRTLTILRKGGKLVTIPLAPRTARAIDLAVGERVEGPIFLRPDGQRMDRHCAGRIVRRVARRAGLDKTISHTPCATRSSPPPWTPACHCATCKTPPATPIPARRCATTVPASRWTGTPPISSPPSSPAPPAETTTRLIGASHHQLARRSAASLYRRSTVCTIRITLGWWRRGGRSGAKTTSPTTSPGTRSRRRCFRPIVTQGARDGAVEVLGQTFDGRYLALYVAPDEGADTVFVITARTMTDSERRRYRRRKRKG